MIPDMKKTLILLFVMLFTGASAFSSPLKILVFSKTAGFRHSSIEPGITALKKITDFDADFTEDSGVFTPENLKKYRVVVFLNTTGQVLNEEQKRAFEGFIRAGGGFAGIHAASDTEFEWPWFGKLVGAYFVDHPNNPNVRPGKFIVMIKNHWATKHMPDEFTYTDEFYNFKEIPTHVTHVLKIDESSYTGGRHPEFHPMSWYHEYDGGRAFYTALGHTHESYTDPLFLEHIRAGIHYAAGNIK